MELHIPIHYVNITNSKLLVLLSDIKVRYCWRGCLLRLLRCSCFICKHVSSEWQKDRKFVLLLQNRERRKDETVRMDLNEISLFNKDKWKNIKDETYNSFDNEDKRFSSSSLLFLVWKAFSWTRKEYGMLRARWLFSSSRLDSFSFW